MMNDQNKAIVRSLIVMGFVGSINGVYLSWLSKLNVAAFWIIDFVQWILIPVLLIYRLVSRYGLSFREFGFSKNELTLHASGLAIVTALTFYPAFFWVRNFVWCLFGQVGPVFGLETVFPTGIAGKVIWLYAAITAGIVESIFYLGLPWLLWSRYEAGNKLFFTLLVSTAFAAVHWEQGLHVVFGAFTFNVVACAWYLRLKNLWPIAIGHTIVDLIAFS